MAMRRCARLCGVFGLIACACGAAAAGEAPPPAADLVARMPSDEGIPPAQEDLAAIVKLGPDAVKDIAQLLVPQGKGDDAKARFALNGLAFHVTRPGAEAERKVVAEALVDALDAANDAEVKAFLMSMLQLTGKDEAVPALAKFLGDADLCEPATRALERIGTAAADEALAKASPPPRARPSGRSSALGERRVKAAVGAILPHAASGDATVRRLALYALANIGDPAAEGVLAKAAQAGAGYERAHATFLYLKFAGRLAEAGGKAECAKICRELIRTRTAPRRTTWSPTLLRRSSAPCRRRRRPTSWPPWTARTNNFGRPRCGSSRACRARR